MVTIEIAAIHLLMGTPAMPWPTRKTEQAAGWDCVAALDEPLELSPGCLVKVPLGFALAIPEGWEAQVRPRSGLASQGIIMPNSPGTVDSDYRGEVSALLYSLTDPFTIKPGDRVCQLLIAPVPDVQWDVVPRETLSETKRGIGGFGSTGVSS